MRHFDALHEQSLWQRISIYKRLGFNWGQMHHDCIPFPVRRYYWLCPFDPECWGDLRLRAGENRLSWLNSDLLKSVCCKSLSRKLISLSYLSSCLLVITLSAISAGNMSSWFCNQIKLIFTSVYNYFVIISYHHFLQQSIYWDKHVIQN